MTTPKPDRITHDTTVASEAAARIAIARELIAPTVRELTLRWFQSPRLTTEKKTDGSIVTPVDREAEHIIRGIIQREFSDDGVLGEEQPETHGTNNWRWVVDPIDGTNSFERGIPHWVLLIGIEHEHDPVAGLIDAPALNETVHAHRGGGAWWTQRSGEVIAARRSTVTQLSQAMIEIGSLRSFDKAGHGEVHRKLCRTAHRNRGWSDGYAFALLATGRVDAAINFGFHRWDLSACAAIIEEAGGRMTNWRGERDPEARDAVATNGALHNEVIAVIR